jgi:glycerol-3-phosphate acyltransferase PlsY
MLATVESVVAGYLLGSIPFGYLLVRAVHGADVRTTGSGNIGATNVARTSPALGVVTLVLDALKGSAAVLIALAVSRGEIHNGAWTNLSGLVHDAWSDLPAALATRATLAALFAVLGHIFPLWLRFRGGKGVATALGAFCLLAPEASAAALAVFVAVALLSRYISLGSIMAATAFPVLVWWLEAGKFPPHSILVIALASALIIARHYQNLGRLFSGAEPRFQLKSK